MKKSYVSIKVFPVLPIYFLHLAVDNHFDYGFVTFSCGYLINNSGILIRNLETSFTSYYTSKYIP